MTPRWLGPLAMAVAAGCGGAAPRAIVPAPQPKLWPGEVAPPDSTLRAAAEPVVPPIYALAAGLMPLSSTGVDAFRTRHPTYDGRGVVIAILDSGIDPGVAGLALTSTGAPKLLDLRDFSGEGVVPLTPVTPSADGTVKVGAQTLGGAGRIARISAATPWYGGELRELPLGGRRTGDLNGNGSNTDVFPLVVVKATDGWAVFIDTNLNGTFDDETPLHDYRQGRETVALGSAPLTLAANLGDTRGVPFLDFVFDNSGHGTHVAGIAAGHDLFGVAGFDGVAPGAQLLGLKISNNARGGIAVSGSIERAMEYAARYAQERGLRLVLNLSFGVGNETEGRAEIDSVVDGFLVLHPALLFAISAGNDGPGLSTLGIPASADLALATGAAFPGAFAEAQHPDAPHPRDVVGWWSARGGELAKPDIIAPGLAFSAVPAFGRGGEVRGGTSMAAPYAVGLAARLISGMLQESRSVSAADVAQALRVSALPLSGAGPLDEGAGEPRLEAAYRWLEAGHQGSQYVVRTSEGASAAFRRDGSPAAADTEQIFRVRHVAGLRAAQFLLRTNAAWLAAPATVPSAPFETAIPVRYALQRLIAPGAYTGVVTGWNPSDTLAGPLFALVTTMVVPYDLERSPLADAGRAIAPARVQRYFLRVPHAGATLEVQVSVADSADEQARVRLYEPSGQPFRDGEDLLLGRGARGSARLLVRGEDLVPGVYELDLSAPPFSGVSVTVQASVAAVALERTGDALEASNLGTTTVAARVSAALLGAVRDYDVPGGGAAPESVFVRVPAWASSAVVDVSVPRAEWTEFTGFGVTDFDSTGQQVGRGPLSYATGRHVLGVTALRGRPLVIELFPAFARAAGIRPWRAAVRVRFLLEREQPVGGVQRVAIVAGGRAALSASSAALALPPGFVPLVETRVHPENGAGPDAVRR